MKKRAAAPNNGEKMNQALNGSSHDTSFVQESIALAESLSTLTANILGTVCWQCNSNNADYVVRIYADRQGGMPRAEAVGTWGGKVYEKRACWKCACAWEDEKRLVSARRA